MGWIAITKDKEILQEDEHGRPVQKGEDGELLAIFQYDFGHRVGVDLVKGQIHIDFDDFEVQDRVYFHNPKFSFWICEETSIVGEYKHLEQIYEWARDPETGKRLRRIENVNDPNSKKVGYKNRTDILHPLVWRPIWFTRYIGGVPTKVIGAQTTTPEMQGAKNVKKLISLFVDGTVGID